MHHLEFGNGRNEFTCGINLFSWAIRAERFMDPFVNTCYISWYIDWSISCTDVNRSQIFWSFYESFWLILFYMTTTMKSYHSLFRESSHRRRKEKVITPAKHSMYFLISLDLSFRMNTHQYIRVDRKYLKTVFILFREIKKKKIMYIRNGKEPLSNLKYTFYW